MATSRIGGWLIAVSTVLVIIGLAIVPFTTPAYVRTEQDRAGVGALTGFTPAELDTATGALLGDMFVARGDFDVAVGGAPVLTERERAHLRDVRGVFLGVMLLVAAAVAVLAIAARRTRTDPSARVAVWRAVGNGARGLALATVAIGIIAALAFEAVFEVFHRLFFTSGSYTFDPATDRLVQIFPQRFWSETTMFLGIVLLIVIVGVAWLAARRTWTADRRIPAPTVEARA